MSRVLTKYAPKVANVCVMVFSVLFAFNVFTSFHEENLVENITLSKGLKRTETLKGEDECSSVMLLNISVAIILAALWNAKKVIKIGAF